MSENISKDELLSLIKELKKNNELLKEQLDNKRSAPIFTRGTRTGPHEGYSRDDLLSDMEKDKLVEYLQAYARKIDLID